MTDIDILILTVALGIRIISSVSGLVLRWFFLLTSATRGVEVMQAGREEEEEEETRMRR